MRSEDLNQVIDSFGVSEIQKQRMLGNITRHSSSKAQRKVRMSKVLTIVVAISLLSVTAFAFSVTELFKGIFGNSIYLVEDHILAPMESVADDQFKLTLDGVLSDGYGSTAIVSVEALDEHSSFELEHIASSLHVSSLQSNIQANRSSVVELDHLSGENKKRFMVGFWSMDEPLTGDLEISLITEQSELTLLAPTDSTIQTITIELDKGHYASESYAPQTILISPLSVVVRGHEEPVGHEIPNPTVTLHFANGTTIDVFAEDFGGARFPEEGVTIVSAQFERIIDLQQLRSVTVDGLQYHIEDNGQGY